MDLRVRGLVAAVTCTAAVLTGATVAQAVEQFSKNGCWSPEPYSGSLTSPVFTTASSGTPQLRFKAWFEIEAFAPESFDETFVEYSLPPAIPGDPRDWILLGRLNDLAPANTGAGQADLPYSNNGTSVPPSYPANPYTFDLPVETSGVQVRFRFDTGDTTYQGFRGVGVDDISIDSQPVGSVDEGFEQGPTWTFDSAGAGAPRWQVVDNSQNIVVKNPEINPDLVTLADAGALPDAASGTKFAWFGDTATGTFCGPDYALRVDLAAPDTTITSGPPVRTANNDATFQFTSNEAAAFFECEVDGGGFVPCASPHTYTALPEGGHTFSVRSADFNGNVDPTPATYNWTIRPATLADLDNPTLGVDVNVQEVAGTVLVGIPRGSARAARNGYASQKGVTFVPLSEAQQIPVGSFLDTRKGTVRLESAANARGKRQRGTFLQGLFQVRQSKKRSAKGLTDLVLKGSSFRSCNARGGSSSDASASLSRRTIRRLRANAQGRYRTSGRNSAATVRGTKWGITDRCDGTLTKVQRGTVVVRDFRRKKNVIVKAGKSYLAKARG